MCVKEWCVVRKEMSFLKELGVDVKIELTNLRAFKISDKTPADISTYAVVAAKCRT